MAGVRPTPAGIRWSLPWITGGAVISKGPRPVPTVSRIRAIYVRTARHCR